MKKIKLFWTLAAIAFAGAVAFAGCEKEPAAPNSGSSTTNPDQDPNQNPNTNTLVGTFDDDTSFYSEGELVNLYPVSGRVHIGIDSLAPADSLNAILGVVSKYGSIVGNPIIIPLNNYGSKDYTMRVDSSSFKTSVFRRELSHSQYIRYVAQEHCDSTSYARPVTVWCYDLIKVWVRDVTTQDSSTVANDLNTLGIAFKTIEHGMWEDEYRVRVAATESTINAVNRLYNTGNFTECFPDLVSIGAFNPLKNRKR